MYDRKLIGYLPDVIKNIKEYQIIQNDCLQPEITLFWENVDKILENQFIDSMTEIGVKRWEKMLNIIPKSNLTLDERKFTIITKLNEELPYTLEVLHERLTNLCGKGGYSIEINENEYYMRILVMLHAKSNFNDAVTMVNNMIPANIKLEILLKYNQHFSLNKYTHAELKQYSNLEVKEKVLDGN